MIQFFSEILLITVLFNVNPFYSAKRPICSWLMTRFIPLHAVVRGCLNSWNLKCKETLKNSTQAQSICDCFFLVLGIFDLKIEPDQIIQINFKENPQQPVSPPPPDWQSSDSGVRNETLPNVQNVEELKCIPSEFASYQKPSIFLRLKRHIHWNSSLCWLRAGYSEMKPVFDGDEPTHYNVTRLLLSIAVCFASFSNMFFVKIR